MATPASRRQRSLRGPRDAPTGGTRGGQSGSLQVLAERPPDPTSGACPADEVYVRSVIEFLDKRWTRAEADLGTALRSLLLLCGTAFLGAALLASVAVAAAGCASLIRSAQDRLLDPELGHSGPALLGVAGVGFLLLLLRGRSGYRRRRRSCGR